nr:MAG: ORF1 [TTV-like mini virus]
MPWRWYRPRYKRRRYYRKYWRGPRKTFRRRFYRTRWVRKKPKRKLKRLNLTEWQPDCIRKCKIKGYLCLFECTSTRISNNYDLYEASTVPEHLEGGGGFSIKNITLNALFVEHELAHNVWTRTNNDLSLFRYTGCKIILYQSENTDYIFTYNRQLPMTGSLELYQSMQPSIHLLSHRHKLIPSKRTHNRKKPYYIVKIKPPTQIQNKWYFQKDLCTTPLVQFRTSAISIDHMYISTSALSTNITIPFLNNSLLQNTNYKTLESSGYYCKEVGTQKVYLYSSSSELPVQNIPLKDLRYLADTKNYTEGYSFNEAKEIQTNIDIEQYFQNRRWWGNPFHPDYLKENYRVYQSTNTWGRIKTMLNSNPNATVQNIYETGGFTEVFLVTAVRYNPYRDTGIHNKIYFKPTFRNENNLDPPNDENLITEGLPLWLLLWGFSDYHKKLKKIQNIDTDYTIILQTDTTNPIRQPIQPINYDFIEGHSPLEDKPNPQDKDKWYPSFQHQQLTINNICACGPATPKYNKKNSYEAKCKYCFYFKWGGSLPPMSTIEDPKKQTTYPIPNNQLQTTSLQNPATAPERLLHQFDQRRGTLTTKALKRIQQDWDTEKYFITDAATKFNVQLQGETSPETSSEEEEKEDNLFQQLQQQRLKQRNLKQRILKTLLKIQTSE